jgi:Protein of unknown function (DUF3793)
MGSMTAVRDAIWRRPVWQELSRRFVDDRECLAAFLALEGAEILDGVKPANMVNVANRRRPCGRNLYQLWKRHGEILLRESGLKARELADRGDSLLLFIYQPEALKLLLARKSVAVILQKAGYDEPGDPEKILAELQLRLAGGGFPHEIGVVLGYPLKDVIGFMGWARLEFTCQGPWKIFGDPRESLRLAAAFQHCRSQMAGRLACGTPPCCCLKATGREGQAPTADHSGNFLYHSLPAVVNSAPFHSQPIS